MSQSKFMELMESLTADSKLETSLTSIAKKRGVQFQESVKTFAELVTNKKGYSSHKREFLMKEAATTSDFPLLLGYTLERTLYGKYAIAKPDYRNYIKTGTQRDFRPVDVIGTYGLQGQLQPVAQRDEYKEDAVLKDGKMPQIVLSKYGRAFGLAWEALVNDDLGGFADLAERLANAALRTEFFQATKLLTGAAGPNAALYGAAVVHPIDGVVIANKDALALSADNLAVACQNMRVQIDADGEPIIIDGFELVVPPALELKAYQILQSTSVILSGGDATAGVAPTIRPSASILANLNIKPHVNPYLPILDKTAKNNSSWYLFASLPNGYAAKLNFLQGHENPELVMKKQDKVTTAGGDMNELEGDFESDSMKWRVRHILGGNVADPRLTSVHTG